MKKIIILVLTLINILVLVTNINSKKIEPVSMSLNEKKIDIIEKNNYKIKVYIPITNYKKLNKIINKKIYEYINKFKSEISNEIPHNNQYHTLIILYDEYSNNEYISYIFRIEYYTGGAHPNHEIFTINYNTKTDNEIYLDFLEKKYKNVINTFSKISRQELIKNPRITDTNMLMDGTNPTTSNFKNFVFSKGGIIIFFLQYQVAPYSQGEFNVVIPYDKLEEIKW